MSTSHLGICKQLRLRNSQIATWKSLRNRGHILSWPANALWKGPLWLHIRNEFEAMTDNSYQKNPLSFWGSWRILSKSYIQKVGSWDLLSDESFQGRWRFFVKNHIYDCHYSPKKEGLEIRNLLCWQILITTTLHQNYQIDVELGLSSFVKLPLLSFILTCTLLWTPKNDWKNGLY